MFTRGFISSGNSSLTPVNPLADQNLTGTWTNSSLVWVRYKDTAANAEKLSLITTNDAWSSYTKTEQLDNPSSIYGGPRSSKTHWFFKGYNGPHYVIQMSNGALTQGASPTRLMYAYDHYNDTVVSQNWSSTISYADHDDAILRTGWANSTQSQSSGYIHGVNALNGKVFAAKGYSSLGSYILVSSDGGANFSVSYSSPGTYSFGGYSIACPGWTGATDGALFWYFGVDQDGAGGSSTKVNQVLKTEDGTNWTNIGTQSNGPGAPTYYGKTRLINVPGTNRIYHCNGSTLYKSTNGYQFTSVNSTGQNFENISFISSQHLIAVGASGTTLTIYKSSDTEDQIDSNTTWSSVNSFTISDADSVQEYAMHAPYPN